MQFYRDFDCRQFYNPLPVANALSQVSRYLQKQSDANLQSLIGLQEKQTVPKQFQSGNQRHGIDQRIEGLRFHPTHHHGTGHGGQQRHRQQAERQSEIAEIQLAERDIGNDLDGVEAGKNRTLVPV